jgi:hypothetical protein
MSKFEFLEGLMHYPTLGNEKVGKSPSFSELLKNVFNFVFLHESGTYGQIEEIIYSFTK